jgi:hypothetical protein
MSFLALPLFPPHLLDRCRVKEVEAHEIARSAGFRIADSCQAAARPEGGDDRQWHSSANELRGRHSSDRSDRGRSDVGGSSSTTLRTGGGTEGTEPILGNATRQDHDDAGRQAKRQ